MGWDGKKIIALGNQTVGQNKDLYEFMLLSGEQIVDEFKSFRDCLIVTNKRLISIDVQGITGKKKEFMSIPYRNISAFSIETAGSFDLDAELKVWLSGIGLVQFEFVKGTKILHLVNLLSEVTT